LHRACVCVCVCVFVCAVHVGLTCPWALWGVLAATSHYLRGFLCFFFADMGWATRQVASALFATPPSCDYQRALAFFLEAEKVRSRAAASPHPTPTLMHRCPFSAGLSGYVLSPLGPIVRGCVGAQVDSGFYKANQLKIAECYDRLGKARP
jgi:hypothetical protein